MNAKKFYWLLIGINCLMAVLILGAVVVGDQLLQKQSEKIVSQKVEDAVLDQQQASLIQAKKDLEKYADLQKIAEQIVPQEKDQAITIREIVSLAEKANVKIGSIGFPSSTLGNPATKTPTANDISQAKPVTGIKDLLELQITVTSDGIKPSSYNQLLTFLSSLENNRRTAQVSGISIQPDAKNPSLLTFSLTLTVYIKP